MTKETQPKVHISLYQMNGGFSGTSLPWDRVLSLPGVIRLHARAGVALSKSQRCEDKRLNCGRGESRFQPSLIVASLFCLFLFLLGSRSSPPFFNPQPPLTPHSSGCWMFLRAGCAIAYYLGQHASHSRKCPLPVCHYLPLDDHYIA